jgi:hypothetical protein
MQPTQQRLSYHRHAVKLVELAQRVARRHHRHDPVTLDGGHMVMLADSVNHSLRIPAGPANVNVVIAADWFLDPDRYRHAIEAAIESAFDTVQQPVGQ